MTIAAAARRPITVGAPNFATLACVSAAASSLLGLAVATTGARDAALLLAGALALLAAASSAQLALLVLTMLILVPVQENALPVLGLNQIDAVYLAGLAGLALRVVAGGGRVRPTPLALALAAFVTTGLLALATGLLAGAEAQVAFGNFRGLYGYAGIALLAVSETSAANRRTLAVALCTVAGLTAARGVLSWAELNGLASFGGVLHRLASPDAGERIGAVPSLAGNFGYVRAWAGNFEGNSLGAFLLLVLPAAAYLTSSVKAPLVRAAFAALALLMFWGLVVSYSRGAYLGLIAASLPLVLSVGRRSPVRAVTLLIVAAVALFVLGEQIPGAGDRLHTLRSPGGDLTVQHRQLVYGQIVDAFRGSPVWGAGLGTDLREIGTGADSLYLFFLLRSGLLGVAAAVALAWVATRRLLDARRAGRLRGLEYAIGAGLFGLAVHSVVDFLLWNPKVALTFWLLAGLLMAAALERDRPGDAAARQRDRAW